MIRSLATCPDTLPKRSLLLDGLVSCWTICRIFLKVIRDQIRPKIPPSERPRKLNYSACGVANVIATFSHAAIGTP